MRKQIPKGIIDSAEGRAFALHTFAKSVSIIPCDDLSPRVISVQSLK